MRTVVALTLTVLGLAACSDDSGQLHDQGAQTTTTPAQECREVAGNRTGTAPCEAVEVAPGG